MLHPIDQMVRGRQSAGVERAAVGDRRAEARGQSQRTDHLINVMLLTSSLERGGAERQVVELANGLDPARFRVTVCSLANETPLADGLRDSQRRLVVVAKRWKYDVGLVLRVARLMRRLDTALVHSFMFDAEIVGRLAGRAAGVPAVICSNRCPHLGRSRFKLWVARATNSMFDRMVANSWAGREFERTRQGVSEDKLCVIPNGVDTGRFCPTGPEGSRPWREREGLRVELGVPNHAIVVGMVAHFRVNKDHETFVHAAARVAKADERAWFVCAGQPDGDGDGSRFGRARRLAESLGIANRVRFLGPRCDADALYRAMDIKVLSTHFEGTPNVVLEAMASGLPVVASDVCDNQRIVVDGETGFVVAEQNDAAMADRILRLMDDGLRQQMGAAARDRAEREYSVGALADRTAHVYLEVLRNKGFVCEDVSRAAGAGG